MTDSAAQLKNADARATDFTALFFARRPACLRVSVCWTLARLALALGLSTHTRHFTLVAAAPHTTIAAPPGLAWRQDIQIYSLLNHLFGLVTRSISVRTGSWIRVGLLRGREVAWKAGATGPYEFSPSAARCLLRQENGHRQLTARDTALARLAPPFATHLLYFREPRCSLEPGLAAARRRVSRCVLPTVVAVRFLAQLPRPRFCRLVTRSSVQGTSFSAPGSPAHRGTQVLRYLLSRCSPGQKLVLLLRLCSSEHSGTLHSGAPSSLAPRRLVLLASQRHPSDFPFGLG